VAFEDKYLNTVVGTIVRINQHTATIDTGDGTNWRVGFGVVRPLVWLIAVEWPLLKVQRSLASQNHEWQVPAEAVVGPQNLTGCSQSEAGRHRRQ
jgi:hypothetical protein